MSVSARAEGLPAEVVSPGGHGIRLVEPRRVGDTSRSRATSGSPKIRVDHASVGNGIAVHANPWRPWISARLLIASAGTIRARWPGSMSA